jgi:SAM-dependent methyltransferase
MKTTSDQQTRPAGPADVLNLGCGRKLMAGALNLDRSDDIGAGLVHDLRRMPWPLPADHFRSVHAYDVVEHLDDVVGTLEEIHRICRPGASVHLTVPHFSSSNAFTDVTHQHFFSARSFEPFDGAHELSFYSQARFRYRHVRISFHPSLVNKIVFRLANRWPHAYEQRWAWIFPAWFLFFELEVVK